MGGSPPLATGSNFLWVGLTANEQSHHKDLTNKSLLNRRPKNHDRLMLTSAANTNLTHNQTKIKNPRRHSAPPGSFEHFLKNKPISTTSLSKCQQPPIAAQTPNRRKSATTASSAMTNRSSGKPASANNLGQKNITKSMITIHRQFSCGFFFSFLFYVAL